MPGFEGMPLHIPVITEFAATLWRVPAAVLRTAPSASRGIPRECSTRRSALLDIKKRDDYRRAMTDAIALLDAHGVDRLIDIP